MIELTLLRRIGGLLVIQQRVGQAQWRTLMNLSVSNIAATVIGTVAATVVGTPSAGKRDTGSAFEGIYVMRLCIPCFAFLLKLRLPFLSWRSVPGGLCPGNNISSHF